MNAHDDDGRDDWSEDWTELDDTLADGPAPGSVPSEAKRWLASQRFMHGLLRALHTADAQDREGRVRRLLASLGDRSAMPSDLEAVGADGPPEPRRPLREWFLFAAAAVLLSAIALWSWLPAELPTVEAAVQRAAAALGGNVDRAFTLVVEVDNARGQVRTHEFTFTSRPGMRCVGEGKLQFGAREIAIRFGCDGELIWFRAPNGTMQGSEPLAKADKLLATMGGVLDVGYLDVQALIAKLPANFPLHTVERRVDPRTGRRLVRIATEPGAAAARLRSAWLEYDEATGIVEQLEIVAEGRNGTTRRVTFTHRGTVPAGDVDYRRPW